MLALTRRGYSPVARPLVLSPASLFIGFVILHVTLWTVVPALVTRNAMLDIIEGLAWGHEWQLGYHKGPPLFAWLVELAAAISGRHLWLIYLESQACIAITFFAVWRLALRVCGELEALIAVLLLEAVYYFGFPTPEFNEIILQMPFSALFGWLLHRAIRDDHLTDWLFAGAIAGAGLWARYSLGAYLIPMTAFMLLHPAARQRLAGPGPYLAVGLSALVFLPHMLWIIGSHFISLRYVDARAGTFVGGGGLGLALLRFTGAQILALSPAGLLVALLAARREQRSRTPLTGASSFDRAYVATLAFGPALTAIAIATISWHGLRSMWGAPLWCFIGLFAVLWLRPCLDRLSLRRFAWTWSFIAALPVMAFAAVNVFPSPAAMRMHKSQFPGAELGAAATSNWHRLAGSKLRYAVGDTWLAGNIGFYSPDRPSVFIDADSRRSPWIDPEDVRRAGAIIVWSIKRRGETIPPALAQAFPDAQEQPPFDLRAAGREPRIGWATLLPRPPN